MTLDQVQVAQVKRIFEPLRRRAAAKAFPKPAALSDALSAIFPHKHVGAYIAQISDDVAVLFATAAVEMWQRSIHSFLISASLMRASPIWACSAGYYSSHYTVRAFAHLFGHFQLHHKRKKVRLELNRERLVCTFDPKQGSDREHQYYWKTLKQVDAFSTDPFFTSNDASSGSEVSHRDRANYADHLALLPPFDALEMQFLKQRVQQISRMQFSAPPIPDINKFPDVDSVQVIAYHRLVRFRSVVDEILGGGNRFWTQHRSPTWCSGIVDFQLVEQTDLSIYQAR